MMSSLVAAIDRWGDRCALTSPDRAWTYAQLGERIGALAAAYQRWGIDRGDRILCQLPTGPEFVAAVGAAWSCGAVHVGASHDLTGPELARLAERTRAAALLYQPHPGGAQSLAALDHVAKANPETRLVVHGVDSGGGHITLDELMAESGASPEEPPFAHDDEAVLFMTSGTTGEPKGVIETLPALWAKLRHFTEAYEPQAHDIHLHVLPMSHAFGFKLALAALVTGGRLLTMPQFSPRATLTALTTERATILPGTPSHLRLLLDRFDPTQHDVSALRWVVTAAAPLPPGLAERFCDTFGASMFHVYGCSEGFLVTTTDRDDIARGSAGRHVFAGPDGTAPDGTITVVEPDGEDRLSPGEVGELAFGARRPVAYLGNPPVAADGWYRTGDLGRIDRDGRVFVVGRVKELINRGGQNVAPGEVEAALLRHPGVQDCAVAGVSDRVLGEAVCACVRPAGSEAPDLAEVRSFLADHLARHKLPDELCVLDHVPRNRMGKIDRRELQAMLATDMPREQLRLSSPSSDRPGAS